MFTENQYWQILFAVVLGLSTFSLLTALGLKRVRAMLRHK